MDRELVTGAMPCRRSIIASMGFSPLLALLPRGAVAAAMARREAPRFLDPHQAAVVTEATARLIPGPADDPAEVGSPGAREVGVTAFIDLMLSAFDEDPPRIFAGGPWSDRAGSEVDDFASFVPLTAVQQQQWRDRLSELRRRYAEGISALDVAAGGDFATAGARRQDEALLASSEFRRLLFRHAVEGMYSAPEYGGNRDLLGWEGIGYAGDSAPRGFSAEEVSGSDGPDPAPADVPLPYSPASERAEGPATATDGVMRDAPGSQGSGTAAPAVAAVGAAGGAAERFEEVIADPGAFLAAALPGLGRRGGRRG